jgi:uncharacterized protein YecT (DUF1311 family)
MKLLLPLTLTALLFAEPLFARSSTAIDCADEEQLGRNTVEQCYKKSDAILNKVYRSLLKKYKGEDEQLLRKAQRAWLITRDAHCTLVGKKVSLSVGVAMSICEHKMTMSRAKELKVLLNMGDLMGRDDRKDDRTGNQQEIFLISGKSFRGIKVGDKMSSHGRYIQKDTLKTGEGDFTVYLIKNFANESIGYFFPDPNNERLVGDITITTKAAATKRDISVGDSFRKLKKKIPALKVYGSELEGRTHARYKNLSYRLDIENFNYKVDLRDIPSKTKIIEITIKRP